MSHYFNVVLKVSSETLKLYLKNNLILKGGAFRTLDGKIFELLKIVPLSASGDDLGLATASRVADMAANVVNVAISYKNGKKLNRIIEMTTRLQRFAWINTALSSANLAFGAASLVVLTRQVEALSRKVDEAVAEIKKELRNIQLEEKALEVQKLVGKLTATVDILNKNALSKEMAFPIQEYINDSKALISWLTERFEKSYADESNLVFVLLFNLTTMYEAVLKEYGAQYYFLTGSFPSQYDDWLCAFDYTDSSRLKSKLKQVLWLTDPTAKTEDLESVFDFTLNTVRLQKQDLLAYKEIVPAMPQEAYFDFDEYVKKKIESGDVKVIEESEQADPREEVLLIKNGYTAA